MKTMEVIIDERGDVRWIYADELLPFAEALGIATTKRASHVEPYGGEAWTADLTPVGGPVLGPFMMRSDALEAEVEWLKANELPEVKEA